MRSKWNIYKKYSVSFLIRELREGQGVWVKLPYGEFVIPDADNVVLLAGGTGITAFIAFIDGLTDSFCKKFGRNPRVNGPKTFILRMAWKWQI